MQRKEYCFYYPSLLGVLNGKLAMMTQAPRRGLVEMRNAGLPSAMTLVPAGPGGQIATGEAQGFGISSSRAVDEGAPAVQAALDEFWAEQQ